MPVTATAKLAALPAATVIDAGGAAIVGASATGVPNVTCSTAGSLVTLPARLVTTRS